MRKTFVVIFVYIIICFDAVAQNKLTEALNFQLQKEMPDTLRVELTAELGLQFRNTNPDSCIYYCEKALALAKSIHFKRGEALALANMGLAMREKGDLPQALELVLQALHIAEPNQYLIETGLCYRRIGLVYMDLKNYPNCLHFLFLAMEKHRSAGSARGITIENMNIAMTYEYMSRLDSALYFIQKAEEMKGLIEDLYPEVNRVFGNIYSKQGKYPLALHYYKKGIHEGLKLNDFRTVSFISADAARMYKERKLVDSSILFARDGVTYGQKASYKKGILFSATLLSEFYDSVNPAEALNFYKIAAAAKDSLFGAGNIQTIQTIVSKEEAREREIERAKAAFSNQLKLYSLIAGLFIFLVIAFILYRNDRQKKKANFVLHEQKKQIENTLEELKSTQALLIQAEKMASLGELTAGVAHEIQNPLNFVNNFSELSNELIVEMQEQIEHGNRSEAMLIGSDIRKNLDKISLHGKRADAIVKGMLQHSSRIVGKKELTDVNSLVNQYLQIAYQSWEPYKQQTAGEANSIPPKIVTEFDDLIGNVKLVPQDIGRALVNVFNNAFYAMQQKMNIAPASYQPELKVSTRTISSADDEKTGEQYYKIEITDNGIGINEKVLDKIFQPFFTTKPTGQGTGLGLSLVYDIVKAHGGSTRVDSKAGIETTFIIELPKY